MASRRKVDSFLGGDVRNSYTAKPIQ